MAVVVDTCTTPFPSAITYARPQSLIDDDNTDVTVKGILPRSQTELPCIGIDYTTNLPLSDAQWLNVWTTSGANCITYFQNNLLNDARTAVLPYEMARTQYDFQYMFSRLFNNTTGPLQHVVSGGDNPGSLTTRTQLELALLNACVKIPGACKLASNQMCPSCDRGSISSASEVINLCGCYAPPLSFDIYKDTTLRDFPQCDPLCANIGASKLVNDTTGATLTCNSNICVIDNISITAANSIINNPQFKQVCAGCNSPTGGPCKCIFDVSVTDAAARLGISDPTVFTQDCPTAVCLQIDSTRQTSTVVTCGSTLGSVASLSSTSWTISTIVIVIAVVVFIIGFLIILATSYHRSQRVETVTSVSPRELTRTEYLSATPSVYIQPSPKIG